MASAGCSTPGLPKSYLPVQDGTSDPSNSAPAPNGAKLCNEARLVELGLDPQTTIDLGITKAIRCADTLSGEYLITADQVANRRQNFRYAEIALGALTLGLAGFEAHGDTLKAAGLATGAVTVLHSSQQYAERISALQSASTRLRCVVDNGRPAQFSNEGLARTRATFTSLFAIDTSDNKKRLLSILIDTISSIERSAQAEYRFRETEHSTTSIISQAIDDAIKLGKELESKQAVALTEARNLNDEHRNQLRAVLDQISAFEQSLVKLAACAAI